MIKNITIFTAFFIAQLLSGQENVDSLKLSANIADDNEKIKSLISLTRYYKWSVPDSSIYFAMQGLPIAKKLKDKRSEQRLLYHVTEALSGRGNFALALEAAFKSEKLAEENSGPNEIAWAIVATGSVYFYSQDYENALAYYKKLKKFPKPFADNEIPFSAFIGEAYFHLGELDSALTYVGRSYELINKETKPLLSTPYYYMGKIFFQKNQGQKSLDFYRRGISIADVPLSTI